MTKQEAIKAMYMGNKVTHTYFGPEEWMKIENGQIIFEDGVKCSEMEFFHFRNTPDWEYGYSIFEEYNNKT